MEPRYRTLRTIDPELEKAWHFFLKLSNMAWIFKIKYEKNNPTTTAFSSINSSESQNREGDNHHLENELRRELLPPMNM